MSSVSAAWKGSLVSCVWVLREILLVSARDRRAAEAAEFEFPARFRNACRPLVPGLFLRLPKHTVDLPR